ncbi:hypothetical protein N782_02350 [Pontibacillus yanchengensis Y32]|uniref:Uncharacterized protein n=2 Tax=Pontibacillus yanchengensis TaxID=462910 RepID=A0A0A2TH20_9BACI|nr:hypothetical protein N782_02350 [Pontibacillus yanchengensis Y32]
MLQKAPKEMISKEKANEIISSANLLKEFVEFNRWQEGENLIDFVKTLNNDEQFINIKNMYFDIYVE